VNESLKEINESVVVIHACNLSTEESEADLPGLHRDPVSKTKPTNQTTKEMSIFVLLLMYTNVRTLCQVLGVTD
jgi:hypothetical protein